MLRQQKIAIKFEIDATTMLLSRSFEVSLFKFR